MSCDLPCRNSRAKNAQKAPQCSNVGCMGRKRARSARNGPVTLRQTETGWSTLTAPPDIGCVIAPTATNAWCVMVASWPQQSPWQALSREHAARLNVYLHKILECTNRIQSQPVPRDLSDCRYLGWPWNDRQRAQHPTDIDPNQGYFREHRTHSRWH